MPENLTDTEVDLIDGKSGPENTDDGKGATGSRCGRSEDLLLAFLCLAVTPLDQSDNIAHRVTVTG